MDVLDKTLDASPKRYEIAEPKEKKACTGFCDLLLHKGQGHSSW